MNMCVTHAVHAEHTFDKYGAHAYDGYARVRLIWTPQQQDRMAPPIPPAAAIA